MSFVALVLVSGSLSSLPQGGLQADTEQGRLSGISSWWSPAPSWESRWWWRDQGASSAWVKAGSFQTGPLVAYSGGDGWRTWSPGTSLTSGHWGVGVQTDSWGVWSIQRPDDLEAGAQGKFRWGPWTLSSGADRTWLLDPQPLDVPWSDRVRAGVTYQASGWLAGAETTSYIPALGTPGWGHRGHASGQSGPWSVKTKGSVRDPWVRPDLDSWSLSGEGGWESWLAGWAGAESDAPGRWEGGWESRGTGARVSWGAKKGWAALGSLAFDLFGASWACQAGAGWGPQGWSTKEKLSATAPFDRGRWAAGFQVESGRPDPTQSTFARWREAAMEAEAKWTTEGFRLGWMGPKNTFALRLRWFF